MSYSNPVFRCLFLNLAVFALPAAAAAQPHVVSGAAVYIETTDTKNTEAKNTEAKSTEAKNTEAKNTEAKNTEAKNTEAKNTEAKNTEAKNTEAKTGEPTLGPSVELSAHVSTDEISTEVSPTRLAHFTLGVSYGLKNLSLGVQFDYAKYWQTQVASDFLLTALIAGMGLDDLSALRLTFSQTLATEVHLSAPHFRARFGPRPQPGPYPNIVLGAGAWGLVELDSIAQIYRLGEAGLYASVAIGAFASFVFSAVTVTASFRPLSQSAYMLDGVWDATLAQFGNPVLELDITYSFP